MVAGHDALNVTCVSARIQFWRKGIVSTGVTMLEALLGLTFVLGLLVGICCARCCPVLASTSSQVTTVDSLVLGAEAFSALHGSQHSAHSD